MSDKSPARLGLAAALAASTALVLIAAPAKADDYTDLLSVLRDRGSLSDGEYQSLLSRHSRGGRTAAGRRAQDASMRGGYGGDSAAAAQDAAAQAAASAAAAQAAMQQAQTMMQSPDLVRAQPYTLGKGLTVRVGSIDFNFSGFIGGFAAYSWAGHGAPIAGSTTESGTGNSAAIRNGYTPAFISFKASTVQNGIDLSAVFGIYAGIGSSISSGAFNANSGGNDTAFGTPGVDWRQAYFTAGTARAGTIKIGRDLGIFASDVILSDMALLGFNNPAGNTTPGQTTIGHIGSGYMYADFIPQITYASPSFAGFQVTVGALEPLDAFPIDPVYSGANSQHNAPMFQGKLTYDYKFGPVAGRVWVGGLFDQFQGITVPGAGEAGVLQARSTGVASAGEIGTRLQIGPVGLVAYYYRGTGLGLEGLFFNGIASNGKLRTSEGYFAQATYRLTPKLKIGVNYGESSLYRVRSEEFPVNLVARNDSVVGGAYYSFTDWLTLIGEYIHSHTNGHGVSGQDSNTLAAGATIVF